MITGRFVRGLYVVTSLLMLHLLSDSISMAQQTNAGTATDGLTADADLANRATSEDLPQISAAVLRTQIQQEQDLEKRAELTRRLVALLVSGGRFDEALAVSSTADAGKDPLLAYWKAEAMIGSGDYSAAAALLSPLLEQQKPGVMSDRITLALARALRGKKQPDQALKLLNTIAPDSPVIEDASLEMVADLLALGRNTESLKLLQGFAPASEEGKAMKVYLKGLIAWESGRTDEARKIFLSVPASTPWSGAASTLGAALCYASSGKPQAGIDLMEKHLDTVDDDLLLPEQFRLLNQLYQSASTPDTTMLKKWAEDSARPARARLAAMYQAKGEFRLNHPELAETLLDAFIRHNVDDPLADQARVLLSASRLRRGLSDDALGWASDRPGATPEIRARLAYLRGLAAANLGKFEDAKIDFQFAASLDPKLSQDALFNKTLLIATTDRGKLDTSEAALSMLKQTDGPPSQEMEFQMALDLARRGSADGLTLLEKVADETPDPVLKSRARLAAAELKMKAGQGGAATQELATAVHENSSDPEREEYLNVFLKDTGKRSDVPGVIAVAKAFLQAHPDSRFVPEVRLKLAEALLSSGDVQGARVEFEQLASSGSGTEIGRRALFLAAQAAARLMDPTSLDDSLMLYERVAETGTNDQLVWQARLQEGALKNAQNLPMESLAIYDKILSYPTNQTSPGPDLELRAATLMAKADTQHQLGEKDPAQEREALNTWQMISSDPALPLRWRNEALCKSGLVLEDLGEGDAALAAYYQAFKNPRTNEPEQLWHDKAAFEAARLLEIRKQWNDAVNLYAQILSEGGPRAGEAKARLAKLRLENFLWEN